LAETEEEREELRVLFFLLKLAERKRGEFLQEEKQKEEEERWAWMKGVHPFLVYLHGRPRFI
jgi:hypothetical protein